MKLIRARERYEARRQIHYLPVFTWRNNRLIDHYRHAKAGVPISYFDDPDEPLIEQVADSAAREPDNRTRPPAASGSACWNRSPPCPKRSARPSCCGEESGLSLEEIATSPA